MLHFDHYVSLGDSMSIDKYAGPGLGAASLLHRNQDRTWPEFLGRDLCTANPKIRFSPLAEDGLTSPQLEQTVARLAGDSAPTLVTVTIGGNDLLHWWLEGTRGVEGAMKRLAEFSARMDGILERLRGLFPTSVTLLANVYDPSDGSGRLQSGRNVSEGLPLLSLLNRTLADIAQRGAVRLVDVHRHFLGHGMLHADRKYRGYVPDDPSGWYVFDIEPNPRGSSEIRRLFLAALS